MLGAVLKYKDLQVPWMGDMQLTIAVWLCQNAKKMVEWILLHYLFDEILKEVEVQ